MARGYSRDLRERLLQAVASGLSVVEVARRTDVSPGILHRWKRTAASGNPLDTRCSPAGPREIGPEAEPAMPAQVAGQPDATLAEHGVQWAAAGQASVSRATMSRVLARLGLPLKKSP